MSLPLYMDVHVDFRMTRALRLLGCDVLIAQEDGTAEWADPDLLDRATELGRILVTQDKDFLRESARRQREGIPFTGVVYAPQRPAFINRYVENLHLIADAGQYDEFAIRVEYLPF